MIFNTSIGLTMVFSALKLSGVIAWSWFLVTAPVTVPCVIAGAALLCLVKAGKVRVRSNES